MAQFVRRFFGKKRGARNMRSDKLGGASLGLFFALVFLGGCVSLGLVLVNTTIPAFRARHKFVASTCRVLEKRIEETVSNSGSSYQPDFHIEYHVNGRAYEAWTYEMPQLFTSDQTSSQAILDQFQIGREYPCWYDPHDPSQVVLVRSHGVFAWLILLVPASFMAIGGGGLVYTFLNWGKSAERRAALAQRAASLAPFYEPDSIGLRFPCVPAQDNLTNSPGTTLAFRLPSDVPTWRMVGTLLIALFWNGIVSVFVVVAAESFARHEPEWFLSLALLPLLAVGLWLVYQVVRQLAITTGMGPTIVEIDRHPLFPGGSYQLVVAQSGRLAVNSLTISLVCDEEAVFRQGTNVRQATCRVYRDEIGRHERFVIKPENPFSARCRFIIPPTAMHSFRSEHNKISWKLIVRGDAIGWPVFERSYRVNVYPQPGEGEPV